MARILIVDDSSFMRSTLQLIIERGGHEVVGSAINGKEAVTMYSSLLPDVMTLDHLMEGGNGLDALKEIILQYPNAKVIVVSAYDQEDFQNKVLESGASSFIGKPPVASELISEIERVLHS